ncbi:hypothetical protein BRD09_08215 [Halobacteriales archaeon SW_10_68_16]|nr:MAG: hypothetical protein BRD09_08215 [Halobacteriales archaeon SW_10_68_16]
MPLVLVTTQMGVVGDSATHDGGSMKNCWSGSSTAFPGPAEVFSAAVLAGSATSPWAVSQRSVEVL